MSTVHSQSKKRKSGSNASPISQHDCSPPLCEQSFSHDNGSSTLNSVSTPRSAEPLMKVHELVEENFPSLPKHSSTHFLSSISSNSEDKPPSSLPIPSCKGNNKFMKYICNITNILLIIFIAQSLVSIFTTFGFFYYGSQTFLDSLTFAQYKEAVHDLRITVDDFLFNMDLQVSTILLATRLSFIDLNSKTEWIKLLGSLQQFNQVGHSVVYVDLSTNEITAVNRLENLFLLSFNETGDVAQLYQTIYDPLTIDLGPMTPYPIRSNVTLAPWYRNTLAQWNGTAILHPPVKCPYDKIVILSVTFLIPKTSNYQGGMISISYDVDTLTTILFRTVKSFIDSRALILDENFNIIASSHEFPYIILNSTLIRHTLFNSSDTVVRSVGHYFLNHEIDELVDANYSTNGYYISVEAFANRYSQKWYFVLITEKTSFDGIITSANNLFAVFAALILLCVSTVTLLLFVKSITSQLSQATSLLFKIARLETQQRSRKYFSLIYELRLLQQSCQSVQLALDSFAKYIPHNVVKHTLHYRVELGVVPSHMSILSCDIEDFTTTSELLDSKQLLYYLSRYFAVMTHLIEKNQGTVDKFIGDAVIGFWNHSHNPMHSQRHEYLACNTALHSLLLIQTLSSQLQQEGYPALNIRVGINSGHCLVGNTGCEQRYTYTVLGDVANMASQLEGMNKEWNSRILIGEETYNKVKDEFVCYWISHNVYELKNWRTRASLEEIELSRRYLDLKDVIENKKEETVRDLALKLIQDFPQQSKRIEAIIKQQL